MRIESTLEGGLGENWFEFDERWTRAEVKGFDSCSVEEVFSVWFPKKCTGLCLTKADGSQIRKVEDLTLDSLDEFDQRIYGFIMRAMYKVVSELFLSGTRNVRLSLRGTEI